MEYRTQIVARGQFTIPKVLREKYALEEGSIVVLTEEEDSLRLEPLANPFKLRRERTRAAEAIKRLGRRFGQTDLTGILEKSRERQRRKYAAVS